MPFWNNVKLSVKLPLIMLTLSSVTLVGMGMLGFYNAKNTLFETAKTQLNQSLGMRANEISDWKNSIQSDVIEQASNPATRRALTELTFSWAALPGDKSAFLKEHFAKENAKSASESQAIDFTTLQTDYARKHRNHHPFFQALSGRNGFLDAYLFDLEGNLIYSVHKSAAFATNMKSGKWRTTGLAQAFNAAVSLKADQSAFVDFKTYEPAKNERSGFIAAPVLSVNGTVMGVYAVRINSQTIGLALNDPEKEHQLSTTMAVGSDYQLRISSLTSNLMNLTSMKVDAALVDDAMAGNSGMIAVTDADDKPVLMAYGPLKMGEISWVVFSQKDMDELLAPAVALRNEMIMQGAGLLVLTALISIFLARSVGKPLVGVGQAMRKIANEEFDTVVPATSRGDEIGNIANVLEGFRDTLSDAKSKMADTLFKGTAFEGSSAGLMVVDQDFIIRLVNKSAERIFSGLESQFKQVSADFTVDSIIGSDLDMFQILPGGVASVLGDRSNLPFHTEITAGGAKIALDINSVLDADGMQIGCVVEWKDVTSTYMNDAILKAIEENQSRAEFSPDGILLVANLNFLALTGGEDNDQIGKAVGELVKFNTEIENTNGAVWDRVCAGQSIVGKFLIDAGGGTDGTLEGAFSPVQNHAGEVVRILLVGNDTTAAQLRMEEVEADRMELERAQAVVVEALRVGMHELSEGNLTAEITESFSSEYEQLRTDFNGAISTLRQAMLRVTDNAESIRGEASDISNAADDLSRRTERQAATLEKTATALDELTASVSSAADGAEQANQVVSDAKSNAEASGMVVREAVDAMGKIQTSSGQISRIISVIDDIAFQTNLLALNAGVEAARAGEAGRGFAVVASEVRALAQRSSDAAREINDLISESGKHVSRGVDLVGQSGEALNQIVDSVSNISVHVSEIAISANEQSSGLAEINKSVNQLDQVTQQNAAMFEETTAASHALTKEAETLSNTMSRFKAGEEESNVVVAEFKPNRDTTEIVQTADASMVVVNSGTTQTAAVVIEENDWEDF